MYECIVTKKRIIFQVDEECKKLEEQLDALRMEIKFSERNGEEIAGELDNLNNQITVEEERLQQQAIMMKDLNAMIDQLKGIFNIFKVFLALRLKLPCSRVKYSLNANEFVLHRRFYYRFQI